MGNQCLPRERSISTQVRSLQFEVDRLSKDKTALEFQLAEMRARYSNLLSDDIRNSYQSICGLRGGPVLEQSFYGRSNILGGHGTQPRRTEEKFNDQPSTNINAGMPSLPQVDCMGTFPRGNKANHRIARDDIYPSRFGDFNDKASRRSRDEEWNEQERNWTWRGAVKL